MNQGLSYEIASVMPAALATGLFVALVTFVEPNPAQGSTGNSIGGFIPVASLPANIPAMNAPRSITAVSSDETRRFEHIEAMRERHMLLNKYYPDLDTGFAHGAGMGWQVVVTDPNGDVNQYTFLGGEGDSQFTQTRVRMQLVTV